MLIYLRHLKHPVYDKIISSIDSLYNINLNYDDDIIMNAIPIIDGFNHYIISSLGNLEISALTLNKEEYKVVYFLDKDKFNEFTINNVLSVHDITNKNDINYGDCFYDEHLNLILTKYYDESIEYIDISDCECNYNLKFLNKINDIEINFVWMNNSFEKKIISSFNSEIVYDDDFIDLPPILSILVKSKDIGALKELEINDYPSTGSKVFDGSGNFVGMTSYCNEDNIIIIPTIIIKRCLKYLDGIPIYKMKNETEFVKINFLNTEINDFNNIDSKKYGLLHKKQDIKKLVDLIIFIDGHEINSNGEIVIDELSIPISTYLWLFKNVNKLELKSIYLKKDDYEFNKENNQYFVNKNNKPKICNIKLKNHHESFILISNIKYIDNCNNFIFELNEKIAQFIKPIIQTSNKLDHIYNYILNNKKNNKKILLVLNNRLGFGYCEKYNNIDKLLKNNTFDESLVQYG